MPASRVEPEPKTAPPRWKTEGDDYKADLTAHPEEIKDLCPIVITTIDCRATDTAGKYEFDKNIEGDENNDYAHFFTNVGVARKEGGWFSSGYNVFEGTDVTKMEIANTINQVAEERKATHCMLYVHGFMTQPQAQIEAAMEINANWEGKGAFCIPVVWPAEKIAYWTQKAGANGAARGLREEILPYLKHKVHAGKDKTKENVKTKISIMCHSMGNYVLKKMAPNKPEEEGGEKDKYVNEKGELVDQKTPAFKFDNIFMVAADVRAWTFDKEKGEETIEVDGKEVKDHDGEDILRLAKHKVHVCWYGGDLALLGRRAMPNSNYGRAAIGRNGLDNDYSKEKDLIEPLHPEGKLVDKLAADKELTEEGKEVIVPWNVTKTPWYYKKTGHMYQTEDKALEYYLTNMKEHCDNKC